MGSVRKGRLMAGISTNVLILGIVSLLTDASSEMIYPIMPLFLTAIGATGTLIGLIEGAAETTASLLKVASGWYSDRYQRRKVFLTSGYGLSALSKPLFALATTAYQVLGIRIVERVGKGIRSAPRDALIADSTPRESWGKAFGFHKAMDSTGAVIGPLLVLPVLLAAAAVTADTYRLIFLLSTIPALAAVAVIVLFVKEVRAKHVEVKRRFLSGTPLLGKEFWRLIAVVTIFYLGEVSYVFFILKAQAAGLDDVNIILLYVLFNLMFVVTAIPSGTLSDRFGRRPVLAVSFLLFAATCAVMALASELWFLALGFVLFGVYKGSSEGVFKAFVSDVSPKGLRGTALGIFHTCVGMVMLPGGLIAGLLWDDMGPWATFAYGGVLAMTSVILLLLLGRGKH
ncbi:MAG: MFS transporter [Methanomassiliicoccales archaeon]|nr:MFS transporter [Methanomassiliicoccales archaeon]